jgi:hypothetical protein
VRLCGLTHPLVAQEALHNTEKNGRKKENRKRKETRKRKRNKNIKKKKKTVLPWKW